MCCVGAGGVDGLIKTLYSPLHFESPDPFGPRHFSTEAQTVKPGSVIRTHRPEQGLGAFVRAASGLASMGRGMHVSAQGPFVPAGHGWLDRAEDQVHPGEGSA